MEMEEGEQETGYMEWLSVTKVGLTSSTQTTFTHHSLLTHLIRHRVHVRRTCFRGMVDHAGPTEQAQRGVL